MKGCKKRCKGCESQLLCVSLTEIGRARRLICCLLSVSCDCSAGCLFVWPSKDPDGSVVRVGWGHFEDGTV